MVEAGSAQGTVAQPAAVLRILADRELLGSTALGNGVAVPHARSLVIPRMGLILARSRSGIAWGEPDQDGVHLIFLLLAPDSPKLRIPYLDLLARLVSAVVQPTCRDRLLLAGGFSDVEAVFGDY